MNTSPALDEAIPDSELRHINFFNGRLLTGEDLSAEQSTQHAHSRHLGEAVGAGVAFGLQVTAADASPPGEPIVNITKGVAVNRAGQTLRLECDQRIALLRPPDPANADACVFDDCSLKSIGPPLASGTGFYVLVIAPASLSQGKAPVSGLGNGVALCNSRYLSEGVKFRVLRLNITPGANPGHIRNAVAYQCFGVLDIGSTDLWQNVLNRAAPPAYGIEALVSTGYLTPQDVPLAIFEWNADGIGFVDQWPARRRISRPAADPFWEPLIGDRRIAEGEAMFLQFQDHIETLRVNGNNLAATEARQHFLFLPPAGLLPLHTDRFPEGFNRSVFFSGITKRDPVYLEGARARHLLRLSFEFPALDLSSGEMIWQYFVRENGRALDVGGSGEPRSYLLFARGQIPFQGEARFDVSRWNYSNFV